MLQNAYFLAKIGADTAENEQHFAEIFPTDALRNFPKRRVRRLQTFRPAEVRRAERHERLPRRREMRAVPSTAAEQTFWQNFANF